MRISTSPHESDISTLLASYVRVYCNGICIPHAKAADDEKGWVRFYAKDAAGCWRRRVWTDEDGNYRAEMIQETVYGDVRFVRMRHDVPYEAALSEADKAAFLALPLSLGESYFRKPPDYQLTPRERRKRYYNRLGFAPSEPRS